MLLDIFNTVSVLKAFPEIYKERGEAIEAEERDARLDTPIFVCQLSFPGMRNMWHFFEPRYVPGSPTRPRIQPRFSDTA